MRKSLAILTLAASLPGFVFAGDHVVTRQAADARLVEAAVSRSADIATLSRTLATPQAERVTRLLGTDVVTVRGSLASLSDQEAHELAVRAAALQSDPVSGLSSDVNTLLIIFLIVAIVIIVLKAV